MELALGRYISRKMFLNLEFKFAENRYTFNDEIITPFPGLNGITSVTYSEKLYKFMIPLSVSYEFSAKKVHYFIRGGFSVASITGVTGSATRKFTEEIPPVPGETNDMQITGKISCMQGLPGQVSGIRFRMEY